MSCRVICFVFLFRPVVPLIDWLLFLASFASAWRLASCFDLILRIWYQILDDGATSCAPFPLEVKNQKTLTKYFFWFSSSTLAYSWATNLVYFLIVHSDTYVPFLPFFTLCISKKLLFHVPLFQSFEDIPWLLSLMMWWPLAKQPEEGNMDRRNLLYLIFPCLYDDDRPDGRNKEREMRWWQHVQNIYRWPWHRRETCPSTKRQLGLNIYISASRRLLSIYFLVFPGVIYTASFVSRCSISNNGGGDEERGRGMIFHSR